MGKRKKMGALLLSALAGGALVTAALWQGLTVRNYQLETEKLSAPVRLALLTDLHAALYGPGQSRLLEEIARQAPDVVMLAGDFYDENHAPENTDALLSALGAAYPCFYVTGNHEGRVGGLPALRDKLAGWGITVLAGTGATLETVGGVLLICGVDDPEVCGEAGWQEQFSACRALAGNGTFAVLLSHRPERTEYFRASGFDLVLAGHAHGGQVRIPGLLNGLAAPHQGFFPDYAGGRYDLDGTTLVVGRGLSRGLPPRVFNPPELVTVDLLPAE